MHQGTDLQLDFGIVGLVEGHRQRGRPLTHVRVAVEVGDDRAFFIGFERPLIIFNIRRSTSATGTNRRDMDIVLQIVGDDKGVIGLRPLGHRAEIVLGRCEQLSRPILGRQSRRSQKNQRNAPNSRRHMAVPLHGVVQNRAIST